MKKLVVLLLAGIILVGCKSNQQQTYYSEPTEPEIRYFVDRIEKGADGELWAVVEVSNRTTGKITMIDIKVEEGFVVGE